MSRCHGKDSRRSSEGLRCVWEARGELLVWSKPFLKLLRVVLAKMLYFFNSPSLRPKPIGLISIVIKKLINWRMLALLFIMETVNH